MCIREFYHEVHTDQVPTFLWDREWVEFSNRHLPSCLCLQAQITCFGVFANVAWHVGAQVIPWNEFECLPSARVASDSQWCWAMICLQRSQTSGTYTFPLNISIPSVSIHSADTSDFPPNSCSFLTAPTTPSSIRPFPNAFLTSWMIPHYFPTRVSPSRVQTMNSSGKRSVKSLLSSEPEPWSDCWDKASSFPIETLGKWCNSKLKCDK